MAHTTTRASVVRAFKFTGLFLLLFVLLSGCSATNSAELPEPSVAQPVHQAAPVAELDAYSATALKSYFETLASRGRFSGAALFARNDSLVQLYHGQKADRSGAQIEMTDQFQLASLSKPFTAYALLTLVDSGLVQLDQTVDHYISDFPYQGVTIRQLLSHTSGLGNYIYVTDSLWDAPDYFMSNEDVLGLMLCEQVPNYFAPGRTFDYCNTNYALIASVIEHVTGQSFKDYMREHVFDPIGMWSSEILDVFAKTPDDYAVIGHYPNGNLKRAFYLDGVVGDKGMYSNILDLYKFYMELKQGNLLSDELLELSMTPHARTRADAYYGLGWRMSPTAIGDTIVFHNGWWRGFRSYFWFSKRDNKVAIILTNSIRGGYIPRHEVWALF